jgi:phospholipase C
MKLLTVAPVVFALSVSPAGVAAQAVGGSRATATPIEHLIVVVGENISFDTLFATYEPQTGTTVDNLFSRGIVDKDGPLTRPQAQSTGRATRRR